MRARAAQLSNSCREEIGGPGEKCGGYITRLGRGALGINRQGDYGRARGGDEFAVVRQAGVLDSHPARRNYLGDGGQRVSGATTNEDLFWARRHPSSTSRYLARARPAGRCCLRQRRNSEPARGLSPPLCARPRATWTSGRWRRPVPRGNKSYLYVLACLGTGGRRGAGSQTEGATVVGAPCLVRSQPSAASCAYASTTVPRATPSWLARVLVDGTVAPGASRPSRNSCPDSRLDRASSFHWSRLLPFDWSSKVVQFVRLAF